MEVHLLNGDALKERFPQSLGGNLVVARECLIEGPVQGDSFQALMANRSKFFEEAYQVPAKAFHLHTVAQFEKIKQLKADTIVHLWFEDDLFCQANLWFCAHLLSDFSEAQEIFLIRPSASLEYGFGGMSTEDLEVAYRNRSRVNSQGLEGLKNLWHHYQHEALEEMTHTAEQYREQFPFLQAAVAAHIERFPSESSPGRPQESLRQIMEELETDEFGPVFRLFSKREAIYGFGDLQVRRLMDQLK